MLSGDDDDGCVAGTTEVPVRREPISREKTFSLNIDACSLVGLRETMRKTALIAGRGHQQQAPGASRGGQGGNGATGRRATAGATATMQATGNDQND